MQAEQQHVRVRLETEERHAEHLVSTEIEQVAGGFADETLERRRALRCREPGEVDLAHPHRRRLSHHLDGNTVARGERRAENFVSRHDRAQGIGERLGRQRAGQAEGERAVVRRTAGLELVQEPQPLLGE